MDTKECTKCGDVKPLSGYYKAKNKKDGLRGECKQCTKAHNSKYYKQNQEAVKAKVAKYKEMNPEKVRQSGKAAKAIWEANNKEKRKAYQLKHNGSEKHKEASRRWCKNNRATANAGTVRYRTAKANRTPSWANDQLIAAYYKEAKRLEELTGIQFHVDHIIPLQGELVSGLHVETNLQLLPAHENLGKSNSFDPMTFCA